MEDSILFNIVTHYRIIVNHYFGAADRGRTDDIHVGNVTLYH